MTTLIQLPNPSYSDGRKTAVMGLSISSVLKNESRKRGSTNERSHMLIMSVAPAKPINAPTPEFSFNSTLQKIQKRGYLRVGISLDLPGFGEREPKFGKVVGLEADISRHIAQQIFGGSPRAVDNCLEFVETSLGDRCEYLQEHHVDLVLANFADTKQRRRYVDFVGHYLSSSHKAVVRQDQNNVNSLEDLEHVRVAVVSGTTDIETLMPVAPRSEVVEFSNQIECINALASGEVGAFWVTQVAIAGLIRNSKHLKESTFQSGQERWGVGLAKGDESLGLFVENSVSIGMESGVFNGSLSRCFKSVS